MRLDPIRHAVRADLADIRLAGQVFAPHFAAPITCRAVRIASLTGTRRAEPIVGILHEGASFEMLEVVDTLAWGIATSSGLVGYVDRGALEICE